MDKNLERVVERLKEEFPKIKWWIEDKEIIVGKIDKGVCVKYYFDFNFKHDDKYFAMRELRVQMDPTITEKYPRIGYTSLSPLEYIRGDLKRIL